MRPGARLHSWLRATLHRSRMEREMENELRFHIERYRDDLMRVGLPVQEATRRAQAEFGAIEARKEECREALGIHLFDELRADLRYARRMLRKSPAFTTAAILSLALGIGANTIIFSAVNHVLLHSLPYQQPARLFALWSRSASHGVEPMHVSAADFYDWRAQSHALESLRGADAGDVPALLRPHEVAPVEPAAERRHPSGRRSERARSAGSPWSARPPGPVRSGPPANGPLPAGGAGRCADRHRRARPAGSHRAGCHRTAVHQRPPEPRRQLWGQGRAARTPARPARPWSDRASARRGPSAPPRPDRACRRAAHRPARHSPARHSPARRSQARR